MKVKTTGTAEYSKYINALICGEIGAGKTRFGALWPNPIFASAEAGLMSIAHLALPYVEIDSSNDLLELNKFLRRKPEEREEELGRPVETVVIDTIDEIQRIFIRERLKATKQDTMTQKDWGWLGEKLKAVVASFRDLDMNFVMLCHITQKSDNDTGAVWYMPQLQGAMCEQIAGYVDLAALVRVDAKKEIAGKKTERVESRVLVTHPIPRFEWLKDRSGKLPHEISLTYEDDYDKIHSMIFSGFDDLPDSKETEIRFSTVQTLEEPIEVESKTESKTRSKPKAGGIPVEAIYEYTSPDGDKVMSRNELPEGVHPIPKGFGTNIYCEDTGHEVESEKQADMARIRTRRILCKSAMDGAVKK